MCYHWTALEAYNTREHGQNGVMVEHCTPSNRVWFVVNIGAMFFVEACPRHT